MTREDLDKLNLEIARYKETRGEPSDETSQEIAEVQNPVMHRKAEQLDFWGEGA
jgi:hypothetical protein